MITQYIAKAMQKATYELLEDGAVSGEIAYFSGAGSQGKADNGAVGGWIILD
jgi:hypothetical protein